jgi:hypothetical protein
MGICRAIFLISYFLIGYIEITVSSSSPLRIDSPSHNTCITAGRHDFWLPMCPIMDSSAKVGDFLLDLGEHELPSVITSEAQR